MKKTIYIFIFLMFISSAFADDPRFSRVLEFELMSWCVGKTSYRSKKIWICACALEETQEDGFFPDYDNDKDYEDDKDDFMKSFVENISKFSNNPNECASKK